MSLPFSRLVVLTWFAVALGAAEPVHQSQIRHFVGFEYPKFARRVHLQADVTFRGFISATGRLEQIMVTSRSGPILSEGVIRAMEQWLFQPCTSANKTE